MVAVIVAADAEEYMLLSYVLNSHGFSLMYLFAYIYVVCGIQQNRGTTENWGK
jgi:hypothetical protein